MYYILDYTTGRVILACDSWKRAMRVLRAWPERAMCEHFGRTVAKNFGA